MADLRCIVVTPEQKVLEEPADAIVVPLLDGELGIYPRHAPLIGRLGAGELRVRQGDRISRLYVEGGFVEVLGHVVSVVTTRAVRSTDLAPDVIHQQLEGALKKKAVGDQAIAERHLQAARFRAMLRAARRARQ